MLDRVVNRGTRTVSVQRGDLVRWLHYHLIGEVKGVSVGAEEFKNNGVKRFLPYFAHISWETMPKRGEPSNPSKQQVWKPSTTLAFLPEARHARRRRKEKDAFDVLKGAGTKSLTHICFSTKSS